MVKCSNLLLFRIFMILNNYANQSSMFQNFHTDPPVRTSPILIFKVPLDHMFYARAPSIIKEYLFGYLTQIQ